VGTEFIEIVKCPKCQGKHRYKLEVERAMIVKMMTMYDMNEEPSRIRVTRLLMCPMKKEDYQATFSLVETSSSKIEKINVLGIAKDGEQ
jgi:hypothetical protein